MNEFACRVLTIAAGQHGVVARWQLPWSSAQIRAGLRGLRRVFRGVYAVEDLSELGWYMAATLAMGPTAAVSHVSALMLRGLRPYEPVDVHVSYLGGHRESRPGLQPHRRQEMETDLWRGIPVTTPTQSLADADLRPHEFYRALEVAQRGGLQVHLLNDVVRLKQTITGFTRSDTEAAFLWLLHENDIPLPLVNQILNGYETDFHWPHLRLVVEVDGWDHHKERPSFNDDRYRGLVHKANGWEVIRVSADHVYDHPKLVLAALRECGARA